MRLQMHKTPVGAALALVIALGGFSLCSGVAAQCTPVQSGQLTATDGAPGDGLAESVSLGGRLALAGAWLDDDAGTSSGSAYVFDVASGRQLFKLVAADAGAGDFFGCSVSVAGGLALVGAPEEDALGSNSGAVYLFDVGTGAQLNKIVAADGGSSDRFGTAVALRDGLALAGAPFDFEARGSAYVFDVATGTQLAKLMASDAQQADFFGSAVAVCGDTALVGNWSFAFGGAVGRAYLFERDLGGAGNWGEAAILTAPDQQTFDWFGRSVAIDGDTAVVGSPQHDQGPLTNAGAAYVFQRDAGGPGAWGLVASLTATEPATDDHFGAAVSISGDLILAGCPYDDGAFVNTGAAYLFQRDLGGPDQWGLAATLTASDAAWLDNFGNAVSIDGDRALVGAVFKDTPAGSNAGAVYLFELGCVLPCPADLSGDGVVDVADLVALISAWGPCAGCPADLDRDGQVAVPDLVGLISGWGPCPD